MGHTGRLELIGKVSYYLGWIALLCGAAVHLRIATSLFTAIELSKRNLFEIGVVCFLICIASELRAHDAGSKEILGGLKKAA